MPENWCWVKLGSIVSVNPKKINVKDYPDDTDCTFIPMSAVDGEKGMVVQSEIQKLSKVRKGYTSFIEDDVIFAKITPCMENKKSAIVPKLENRLGFGSTEFHVLRGNKDIIYNKYIYYFVRSHEFLTEAKYAMTGAVGQQRVSKDFINGYYMPVPPLDEQVRIVNRIESLFDKVDKADGLVDEARDGFEKRRAAILERAFCGDLTRKWREENGVEFNEDEISLSEVVNVNPKKPKLEVDDGQICSFIPMVAVSDVNGKIEAMEERPYAKVKKGYTYFEEGDVLFAKITPCMENGKSCIAEGLSKCFGFGTTEFHVLRCGEKVLNKYVYYLVRAKWFREEAKQHMTGAVGQQRVPKTYLEDYMVWVPSIEEQEEVVRLLEYMLDKEFEVEELCDIDDNVELLKKSILGRAFRGELGSNNVDEESSIELLKELIK
ncbi:restriction endonuclease subunit S [Romboutsia maritimum]|uniref:restriction endonuclease subunit S n=1 Tax=Romboutsia maritimum TaxID=2020948 RepID=UPI001314E32E|nr:restriction endonuclease subunit S [Romboutsia maritimum]